jgi:hypothetical protein
MRLPSHRVGEGYISCESRPRHRPAFCPDQFELKQDYPKAFNSGRMARSEVPEKCDARLSVFAILGYEAALLVNEQKLPGSYTVRFDASRQASGVRCAQARIDEP